MITKLPAGAPAEFLPPVKPACVGLPPDPAAEGSASPGRVYRRKMGLPLRERIERRLEPCRDPSCGCDDPVVFWHVWCSLAPPVPEHIRRHYATSRGGTW